MLRTLQVLLAPHLPLTSVQYYIDSDGLHGVEEKLHSWLTKSKGNTTYVQTSICTASPPLPPTCVHTRVVEKLPLHKSYCTSRLLHDGMFSFYCIVYWLSALTLQDSDIEPKRLSTVLFHMSTCLGEFFVCSAGGGRQYWYTQEHLLLHVCLWN